MPDAMAAATVVSPATGVADNFATVYVEGLPDGIDDATLVQMFEGFGHIIMGKVTPGRGVLKFAALDAAQTAVSTMNGFGFGGATLKVWGGAPGMPLRISPGHQMQRMMGMPGIHIAAMPHLSGVGMMPGVLPA